MKQTRFLLVMMFISMLVGTSCSNRDEMSEHSSSKQRLCMASADVGGDNEEDLTYDEIDVYEFIERTPEIFGENILVFDSLEVIDNLLEQLEEMDYRELREWCTENNICTSALQSKILYDSIWDAKADEFGIAFEQQDLDEVILDAFYEALEMDLLNHPDCWYEVEDEEYGICKRPRCASLDDWVFCNNKNIFIADKVVFKYQDGYLLTCPVHKYAEIEEYADMNDLYERIQYEEAVEGTDCPRSAMCIAPMYPEQETIEESLKSHIVKQGDYKLSVYITAYPYWSWGDTHVRGKAIIDNYYKGKSSERYVTGEIRFGATITCGEYTQDSPVQFFVKMEKILGTYKSRTLRANWYRGDYRRTTRSVATPRAVKIAVEQHSLGGVNIQYTHW